MHVPELIRRKRDGGGTSSDTIACMFSKSLARRNSRSSVSISHITMPSENRSLRRSISVPLHCSGDMYVIFPFTVPDCVSWLRCSAFATPKSTTLTVPS